MQAIVVNGQKLTYRDEGSGPVLLCLSANPGDSRDFDAITPALARSYRVLRLDWPGYGGSPAPLPPERAGADYFLEVFTGFVQQLGLRDVSIIGNSVGGNVAAHYALRAPERVRGLVLVSPGGFTRHNPVTRLFCRLQGRPGFNRFIGKLFTRLYLRKRNAHTQAMIQRGDTEQHTEVARRVNAAVWRSFLDPRHDLRSTARELRVPALVVSGRYDPVIPARSDGRCAAQAIPGARQIVLPSGHAPFAEIPEEFLAAVTPFLASLNPEPARAAG